MKDSTAIDNNENDKQIEHLENEPSGIPEHLYRQLCITLLDCGPFDTDQELKVTFVDNRLSPWRNQLPQASNPTSRVESVVEFLQNQYNNKKENALVLLLCVLRDRVNSETACHHQLAELADLFEDQLKNHSQANVKSIEQTPENSFQTVTPLYRKILVGLGAIMAVGIIVFTVIYLSDDNADPDASPLCKPATRNPDDIRVLASHIEGDDIRWWVGRDGHGLRTFTCPIDSCTEDNFASYDTFLLSGLVLDLAWEETITSPQEIWVSTAEGSLVQLIKQSDQWIKAKTLPQKYCPADAIVFYDETLYLGPYDAQQAKLYVFDKQEQWDTIDLEEFPKDHRLQVEEIMFDKDTQELWIGTTTGLYRVYNNQSSSTLYPNEVTNDPLSVKALAKDDEGLIWVGTGYNGLFHYNLITNEWIKVGPFSGHITAISFSVSNKQALIGTDNGLRICQWHKESSYQCSYVEAWNIEDKIDAVTLMDNGVALIGVSNQLEVVDNFINLAE